MVLKRWSVAGCVPTLERGNNQSLARMILGAIRFNLLTVRLNEDRLLRIEGVR